MSLVFTSCDGSHVDNTKELYTVATLLFQGNPMDIGYHSYGSVSIDRSHMTLWRPHWCTIAKKRWSCRYEVKKNIVICQWRADQLFTEAEGRGK